MASTTPKAIPEDSWVLVTGANGYIASHVCNELLKAGYRVKGAVRSPKRITYLQDRFEREYGKGRFEVAIVPDFAVPGAYFEAMQGCSGICHVASNLDLGSDPEPVIQSVLRADLSLLEAAKKTPSIKRIVLTSSTKAGFWPTPNVPNIHLDASSWNETSLEAAYSTPVSNPLKPLHIYSAAKTRGERAMWQWMEENKPHFALSAILPDLNFGEFLDQSPSRSESSGGYLADVYRGSLDAMMWFAPVPSWFVDVSDIARLHVGALIEPDVVSERIWGATEPFHINGILAHLRALYPDRTFAPDQEGFGDDLSIIDNARGTELLRRQGRMWITQRESIRLNTKDCDTLPAKVGK